MLIDSKEGQDIFEGQEDIVVFAINAEGVNDSGFAGIVARRGWPELANMGECQIGDVFEKEIDGKRYCGIVCHTLSKIDGWGTPEEQTRVIREAFNKIETRPGDIISSIAIGNGLIGKMSGANYEAIVRGMHESDKDVVLYGEIPEKIMLKVESKEEINEEIDEEIDEETKAKIPGWIERGKAIVYSEKLEEWENCVNIRASDLYHGWDLENALEIMEKLENDGTMEEAKQIFEDANHSGASASMVRNIVLNFSKYGPDFYEKTAFMELSEKEKNEVDKIYLQNKKFERNIEKEKAKAKIPGWIEKGKALTYPERYEEWERCVNVRANDLYHGWDLENALEIMEKLQNEGTMEEAKQIFEDANHSGASAGMVRSIVLNFSKKGIEFYEETAMFGLSEEEKSYIEDKKRENEELAQKYGKAEKEEMPDYIQKLSEIKKDELTEIEFYENVLQIIKDAKESKISLTEEEAELLKDTLLSIGCKKYSDWKAEKDAKGEMVVEGNIGEGIENGDIATGVSFVHQLLGSYDNAKYALSKMLDGGEEYGWVQQWLRNSKQLHETEKDQQEEVKVEEPKVDKFKIPYYQVAKEALMKEENISEDEAKKIIEASSLYEIEQRVRARSSIMHAVEGIAKSIDLNKEDEDALKQFVLTGEVEPEVLERAREGIVDKKPVNVLMDSLKEVHDGWVKENVGLFSLREKKHQHMPFELIGWNEVKEDLVFANPIFLSIGVGISRPLEYDYLDVVKDYLLDNKIATTDDLVNKMSNPEEFYPALKGQDSIIEKLKDKGYVRNSVIPQIEEKGLGKIEDVRKDVLNRIAHNPQEEDLEKVTAEEREYIAEYLDNKIEEEQKAVEELKRKNEIIGRIKEKSARLRNLRKEYSIEELASMRKNEENK